MTAGDVQRLGDDGALVGVEEVVGQSPRDAVEAERQGQREDGQQQQLEGSEAPPELAGPRAHVSQTRTVPCPA